MPVIAWEARRVVAERRSGGRALDAASNHPEHDGEDRRVRLRHRALRAFLCVARAPAWPVAPGLGPSWLRVCRDVVRTTGFEPKSHADSAALTAKHAEKCGLRRTIGESGESATRDDGQRRTQRKLRDEERNRESFATGSMARG